MGVRVFEQGVTTEYLKRHRHNLNPNDMGRLKGTIWDRLGKLGLTGGLVVALPHVMRVGHEHPDGEEERSKFALVPDREDEAYGRLVSAHGVVLGALQEKISGFEYPFEEYVPHLTVAHVYNPVSTKRLEACEDAVRAIIAESGPVMATLDPLELLPK